MNPDLIQAGDSQQMPGVQGFPQFRGATAELPTVHTKVDHYYIMVMPAASMHRADGKRLAFVHGILKTDIKADIDYVEEQIAQGSNYVRVATPEEVHQFNMKVDPKGTIKQEVEQELRGTLEAQIRAEMLEEFKQKGLLVDSSNAGAALIAGADGKAGAETAKVPGATVTMEKKVEQLLKPQSLAEKLAEAKRVADAAGFQKLESKPSGLGGQNTDDIKSAAVGSTGAAAAK